VLDVLLKFGSNRNHGTSSAAPHFCLNSLNQDSRTDARVGTAILESTWREVNDSFSGGSGQEE
jgi:hypothetical protein